MNLKVKVCPKENVDIVSFFSEVKSFRCRINCDVENGEISAFDIFDKTAERLINLIYKFFEIKGIDYIPCENGVNHEDSSIEEITLFENKEIKRQLKSFVNNLDFVMKCFNMNADDVCKFIISLSFEMKRAYNFKDYVKFSLGDVVDCNFGHHVKGELSGGHMFAVILDADNNGMIYVVPICKLVKEKDDKKYLTVNGGDKDITFFSRNIKYTDSTALIWKACAIHRWRINGVIGRASDEFLEKLIKAIPNAHDFSSNFKK